ncbi:MAG: hypothetical protein JOZ95_27565 [Solirubrobacterales bacterium]|nr:hypothetical protein [Solirubrobacterales bacterium]
MLPGSDVARIRVIRNTRVPAKARDEVRVELERERQAINIVRAPPAVAR